MFNEKQISNCIMAQSAHNVIPILRINSEYDLILNSTKFNSWNWKRSPRLTKLIRQQIFNFAY